MLRSPPHPHDLRPVSNDLRHFRKPLRTSNTNGHAMLQVELSFRNVAYSITISIARGSLLLVDLEQLTDASRWRGEFPSTCESQQASPPFLPLHSSNNELLLYLMKAIIDPVKYRDFDQQLIQYLPHIHSCTLSFHHLCSILEPWRASAI